MKVFSLRNLRSHSPGLCRGRNWNPGLPTDPTARAVGFNHCPGRSGQHWWIFSGLLSSSVAERYSILFSEVLTGQGAFVQCPPNRYNTPFPGPGPFRERSIFQVLDGLLFLPRPGDQSGPRSVPERRAITHERDGHGTVCSGARTPRKGVLSPEPRKGSRVGDGEGVNLPKPAISLSRTLSRAGLESRSTNGPDRQGCGL